MAKTSKTAKTVTPKDKPKTLWDHLKQITDTKNPLYWDTLTDADRKSWSTYMIMRFLSMNPDWIVVVNELQKFVEKLDPPIVYELLVGVIPHSKVFLKYVKAEIPKHSYDDWLVDLVKREFECKTDQAVDYINILRAMRGGSDRIITICRKYGVQDDKMKKLKL
jgi:hypothetical protein